VFLHSADQQLDFTSVKAGLAKVEVLRADLTTMRRELRREKTTHRLNALKRELSPGESELAFEMLPDNNQNAYGQ
jgi:hypothetical protein